MCRNSRPVLVTLLFSVCVIDCINITANVGTKVILPCNCSSTSSLISWQRGSIVVYAQNKSLIASQYQGRTEIQKNSCSLILSQVRISDEAEYTCYHKADMISDVHTTLQVTECHNITANVGTYVILPCTCSSTSSLISWQIGETIVYAQNRSLIASQYQGRTEIQENSCSLILSQVRTSDEGEYTCYHKAETFSDVHTTLQVTDLCLVINNASQGAAVNGPDFHVLTGPKGYWYVLVVLAVCGSLLVLLIPLSVWLIKRRKRTNESMENQPENQSLKDPEDHVGKRSLCVYYGGDS